MTKVRRSNRRLVSSAFIVTLVAVLLLAVYLHAIADTGDSPAAPGDVSSILTPTSSTSPTSTPSETIITPVVSVPTGYTSHEVSPLGVHAWAYTVPTLQQYPHACIAGVLVPGDLVHYGVTWADVAELCTWTGPAESVLDRLSDKLRNHLGSGAPINLAIYVPEWTDYGDYGKPGSGVSITETTQLYAYLGEALEVARETEVALAYGPATALVALEWEWGRSYTLDGELISALAARLHSGDLWMIRPMQMQFIYPPGPDFARAIEAYIGDIRAGNPDVAIWVHLALQDHEGAGAEFLAYRESLMHLDIAGTYMGVASGTTPALHPGTIREIRVVLEATVPD